MLIYVSIYAFLYLNGGYMDFAFHWTTQKDGKYAIRKRDTGKRGENNFREAGKEIERKEGNQTSGTHFFLTIDNGLWEVAKINRILKTITYNYVYKGTNRKALRRYLAKSDIETILKNITDYENKTIDIKINPPKTERIEAYKKHKETIKRIRHKIETYIDYYRIEYGEPKRKRLFDLVIQRENKDKELKRRQKETKTEIKELTEKIKRTSENMKRFEKTINADVEKIDKDISAILRSGRKGHKNIDDIDLEILSLTAKTYEQREAANKRQKIYRENKKRKTEK
jgi:transcription termination factor NusB